MSDIQDSFDSRMGIRTVPISESVGMPLAHDITEIRKGNFKGRAFKKGHIVKEEDIMHLLRLGKEHLYVLDMAPEDMHEDDAAFALARALMGAGVEMEGEPKEGKINIIASRDGLLKIHKDALKRFNMLGEVMCATIHTNTVVRKGQVIAGTRAIPLVIKKEIIDEAVHIANKVKNSDGNVHSSGVVEVRLIRKPQVGLVITGNEIYYGRIKDEFGPLIRKKIQGYGGEIMGIYFAPDDPAYIENRIMELLHAGADLLITTGGMSVDPDDVTRFAIRKLGVKELHYGSSVLPGAMFLVAYFEKKSVEATLSGRSDSSRRLASRDTHREVRDQKEEFEIHNSQFATRNSELIPILGIPACGMYHKITVFDLILPRILAGEHIGREEIAEMGHGGFCLNCKECRYPVCPFGK